jgi:hypothetical protein
LSYSSKFRSRPSCFGTGYNDKDQECRKECPFRESCYEKMDWEEEEDDSPAARRRRRHGRERGRGSKRRTTSDDRSRDDLPYPPDELVDELLYLEDGEPWHHRLGWNALSGGISAMGGELSEFFRVFRFQPKARAAPRRPEPMQPERKAGKKGCGDGGCDSGHEDDE